jgi:hypothetical protein
MQDEDLKLMGQIVASNGRNTPPAMSVLSPEQSYGVVRRPPSILRSGIP